MNEKFSILHDKTFLVLTRLFIFLNVCVIIN